MSNQRITRRMVVEDNLVDRYLLGRMDESEAMAFEDFYAGSPETLEELETSALLIDGMQGSRSDAAVAATNVTRIGEKSARAGNPLTRMLSSPAYGVAASFVAIAALLIAVSGNLRGPAGLSEPRNATNIPVVTMSPTRGATINGDQSSIEISKGQAEQVVFVLDVGMAEPQSYSATLHTSDGDLLWRADGLQPDLLDSLTMSIAEPMLPNGDYRFIVRSENSNADTLTFPFAIRE